MPSSIASKLPIGTILADKYRLVREIGHGGMAAIYEAENVDIGKRVAVKVLAAEYTTSVVVVERFLREARAAAAISSPYICDVYDSGKLEDNRPFLVLELLEGESLYERMTRVRQIDVPTTVRMVAQVARGLTKAHAAGIVHRDLKPENIFLTKDEEGALLAKILDFGLAKFYAQIETDGPQARLTREGAVFGTPAYMSPEQVKGHGHHVDHRADLWALGCMTYECFTGRTVWSTEQGVAMTFAQIASASLPDALAYRPDLPASFRRWFAKALARTAEDRFQTAKELADELAACFAGEAPGMISIVSLADAGAPLAAAAPSGNGATEADAFGADELPTQVKPPSPSAAGKYPPLPDSHPISPPVPPPTESDPILGATVGTLRSAPPAAMPVGPAATGDAVPTASAPQASPKPPAVAEPLPAAVTEPAAGGPDAKSGPDSRARSSSTNGAVRRRKRRATRAVLTLAGVGAIGAGGYLGWLLVLRPAAPPVVTPPVRRSSRSQPSAAPGPADSRPRTETKAFRWAAAVGSAQEQIAAGSALDAVKTLKEASEAAPTTATARTIVEQAQLAATSKGPCRITGLARLRPPDLTGSAGRPEIAFTPKGALVTWTDDHESNGHDHAYSELLDSSMKSASGPRDVTPEAGQVGRAHLFAVGDRVGILYADVKGSEAGLHGRWLDAEGRILTPLRTITNRRPSNAVPAIDRAPDGTFWVAWEDERKGDSTDLYLRHLSAELEPIGNEIRATDYLGRGPKPKVKAPSIGISGGFLHVAYRFERDPSRQIDVLRIGLLDPALPKGLDALPDKRAQKDRQLGELRIVNTGKEKGELPSIDCGAEGCYLVWQGESGGAFAAYVEASHGQIIWRKKFEAKGSRPNVAVDPSGDAEIVWFEGGRVKLSAINRDGIGLGTIIGSVANDAPNASITSGGAPGEWYVAWIDNEASHLEPYAVRAMCR
jgi:eukaryotic-like serine/threonine-protein kinase